MHFRAHRHILADSTVGWGYGGRVYLRGLRTSSRHTKLEEWCYKTAYAA